MLARGQVHPRLHEEKEDASCVGSGSKQVQEEAGEWNTEHKRNLGATVRNRAGKPSRLEVGEDNIFFF